MSGRTKRFAANAVYHATGKKVRDLPFIFERLF